MNKCPHCAHKEHRRTELIKFRVSEEELSVIKAGAARAHLSVSAYLRKLAFEDRERVRNSGYKGLLQRTMAGKNQ